MKKNLLIGVAVVLLVSAGLYWYFAMQGAPEEPVVMPSTAMGLNGSADQTNMGQAMVSPVLSVASSADLGNYLTASNGMTLYVYAKDAVGVSNCSGVCAVNWPPYQPSQNEPLIAGDGVAGKLGTITRDDGTVQLTYNDEPVYFWKNDLKPGDTTGQGVGGVWYVAKP